MRRPLRIVGLALGVALLTAPPARADDTHYQNYPLGGRAVGLGGAFTALASDPSGLYYNPAGIVDARHHSVQVSTNLYSLEISDTFFEAFDSVDELQTVFADLNIIPSAAAVTGVLDEDDDGIPTTSYALGSFVPTYRAVTVDQASADTSGCRQLSYERTVLDRTFLFGAAMAHRLDDTWQFGASAQLAYRNLREREEVACFGEGAFSTNSTTLDLAAAAILLSFGLKARLGQGLFLGVNVTSPSIRAFDSGSIRVRQGGVDSNTGESRFLLRELDDLSANTRYGMGIRTGLAWVVPKTVTLAFDLDIRTPTKYDLVELPPGQQDLRNAITIVTEVERHTVVNLNLGGEYLVTDGFSVSGGFFTNFSSAPTIPDVPTFDRDYLPDISTFGGTLVLGFFNDFTLTRVGAVVTHGRGLDVVPQSEGLNALGTDQTFLRADITQTVFYFFASSTFRY